MLNPFFMKKVIITGSTGMVGKGVLLECLESDQISEVLLVNRHPIGMQHPKMREVILADFRKAEEIREEMSGYDACFYCMGVSAVGMNEFDYSWMTYDTTESFARTLHALNPEMTFIYVSGTGTDSTEKGRVMWARVKGRTENMVFAQGFKQALAFRPGVIIPEKGIRSRTRWYNLLYDLTRPFFGLLKRSDSITTTTRVGKAMIRALFHPPAKKVLENRDINQLASGGGW